MKNCLFLALMLFLSMVSNAGEITLNNGDRLSGELTQILGGNVFWKSENVGDVVIKIEKIQSISTATQFQTPDLDGPCLITGLEAGILDFECTPTGASRMYFTSIDRLETYFDPTDIKPTYRGKLVASGRQKSGNTNEKSWSIDSETTYRNDDRRHQTKVDYDKLDADSDNAGDRLVLRYAYDWFYRESWYWFNNLELGFDEPADIESRFRYGTGLGYQAWDRPSSALAIESGLSYVSETSEDPITLVPEFQSRDRFAAWRWSLDFRHLLMGKVQLFHKHQAIFSLEDSDEWTLETETGASAPFVGNIYGEVKIEYDVNNEPAEDKRREDTQINVGVGYNW